MPTAAGVSYVPPSVGIALEAARPTPSGPPTPTPAPEAVVPPPTGQVSFAAVSTIFNARCIFCHMAGRLSAGLDLQAGPGRLIGVPSRERPDLALVNPGAPDLSYLWLKVSQEPPPAGRRMPRNGDPLLPDELEMIRLWIAQGAKAE